MPGSWSGKVLVSGRCIHIIKMFARVSVELNLFRVVMTKRISRFFCLLMWLFAVDAGYSILQRSIFTYKGELLRHFSRDLTLHLCSFVL